MKYSTNMLAEIVKLSAGTIWEYKKKGIITPIGKEGGWDVYNDSAVKAIREYRRAIKEKRKVQRLRREMKKKPAPDCTGTICWQCIHTYGTACSWATAKIPVKGWVATPIKSVNYQGTSYKVKECPNFEKELFEVGADGIKRRVNTVPEMLKSRPIDVLDLYHRSKRFI